MYIGMYVISYDTYICALLNQNYTYFIYKSSDLYLQEPCDDQICNDTLQAGKWGLFPYKTVVLPVE